MHLPQPYNASTSRPTVRRFAVGSVLLLMLAQACGDTTAPVASIELNRTAVSLTLGSTTQLTATPLNGTGGTLPDRLVTWTSSDNAVATVSASGLVTATGVGTATITATSEARTATATVVVTPVPVSGVQVTPVLNPVIVGRTVQLSTITVDAAGNALTGRTVTYTSSHTNIASVSSTGLVTGVAPGTAVITATSEGRTGQATIVVSQVPVSTVIVTPNPNNLIPGGSVQLIATARDNSGNVLTGRPVAWASSNETVAVVTSSGRLIGIGAGTATITATVEGQVGQAGVTVASAVATLEVTPTQPVVQIGASVQLSVTLRDASGTVLTGRPVSWTSSNTAVATVSASGLVSGIGAGTATITVSSEGKSTSVTVLVGTPIATIDVTPNVLAFAAGTTAQLTATARDASGNVLTGRTFTWTSSNTSVARVSATGLVTGVGVGTATITASAEGKTFDVPVAISSATLASVDIDPPSASLTVNGTITLNARARDTQGSVVLGRTFTWQSNNPGVATVNAQGVVTAVGVGTATISATTDNLTGTSTITVTASFTSPLHHHP